MLKKEPFNKELVSVCYVLGTLFSARVIGEQNILSVMGLTVHSFSWIATGSAKHPIPGEEGEG